jgi:hypothetical protein
MVAPRPLSQHVSPVLDVGPGERGLERSRHLEANCRNDDAVGRAATNGVHGYCEPLGSPDSPSHTDHPNVESIDVHSGRVDQLVGGLKRVENSR